ncbi:MAG: hypothetical protein WBD36_05695 [Bacteroidota bacterium]
MKELTNNPQPNQRPKTFFWLFPDSNLATVVSRQHLRWWGEDRDGYVVGYLLSYTPSVSTLPSPDTLSYVFTTQTDTTVLLPIRQSFQDFLLVVRAVDNSFHESLTSGAIVRLSPDPYWDVNVNGVLDGGDVALPSLRDAMDADGAKQKFPIKNSPPIAEYVTDPDDPARLIQPPDTTFPVITFVWNGSDPDGDETVASYRISLNDSSVGAAWLTVASTVSMVTLMVPRAVSDAAGATVSADAYSGTYPSLRLLGSVQGLKLDARNKLYVQARDVAGDFSNKLEFPTNTRRWYVKKPKSRLLVVSDYQKVDSVDVRKFYRARFANVAGGLVAGYDEYDVRTGSVLGSGKPGTLVPALSIVNPMFVQTLKLYDYVFWYTDVYPSLTLAQFSLFYYTTSGGKVLYTTEFQSTSDPSGALRDFAPIDSVSSVVLPAPSLPSLGDSRIPKNYRVIPDSAVSDDIYPSLNVDSVTVSGAPIPNNINAFMRPVYRRADARYIYHFQEYQGTPARPYGYLGTPNIGVIRNDKNFVFFGFPLHYLNGTAAGGQGITVLFNKVFVGEFGLQ